LLRLFPEPEAAVLALNRLDVSELAELVHDLRQVASRYIKMVGNFTHRRQIFVAFQAGKHQNAERVVGVKREFQFPNPQFIGFAIAGSRLAQPPVRAPCIEAGKGRAPKSMIDLRNMRPPVST